jgi:hypothetical protein
MPWFWPKSPPLGAAKSPPNGLGFCN